jgi:hypothetical protein
MKLHEIIRFYWDTYRDGRCYFYQVFQNSWSLWKHQRYVRRYNRQFRNNKARQNAANPIP